MPAAQSKSLLLVDAAGKTSPLLETLVHAQYVVQCASEGSQGLEMAARFGPDLILIDTELSDMNGYEVCLQLQRTPRTRHIPVIMMGTNADPDGEERSFEIGAVDYIARPMKSAIILARVRARLASTPLICLAQAPDTTSAVTVDRSDHDLSGIHNATILAIATLAETRDSDTGNHLRRTQRYVRALAWKLSPNPKFSSYLTPSNIGLMFSAAPLHDIGKVAIPDRILLKPGKLTPEEFEIMKTHTTLGRDAIAQAEQDLGEDVPFLEFAKEIAFSHQEKWDGSGYPLGLQGDQIPVSARLMAVADVYDALISRRVYKEPMPHVQAVQVIEQVSGRHFDPDVVQAFMAIHDTFETIAVAFADSDADLQPKVDYLRMVQGNAP